MPVSVMEAILSERIAGLAGNTIDRLSPPHEVMADTPAEALAPGSKHPALMDLVNRFRVLEVEAIPEPGTGNWSTFLVTFHSPDGPFTELLSQASAVTLGLIDPRIGKRSLPSASSDHSVFED